MVGAHKALPEQCGCCATTIRWRIRIGCGGCVGSRLWHVATKPCIAPCTMVPEPTVNYTVRRALALVHTAAKLRARPAPSLSSLTARKIETRALCAPTITPRSSRLSRTAEWVGRGEERCDTTDRSCAGFSLSTTERHRRSADRERSALNSVRSASTTTWRPLCSATTARSLHHCDYMVVWTRVLYLFEVLHDQIVPEKVPVHPRGAAAASGQRLRANRRRSPRVPTAVNTSLSLHAETFAVFPHSCSKLRPPPAPYIRVISYSLRGQPLRQK